jgi:hypothetical protein
MMGCGQAFFKYGIEPEQGAIAVVRPDLCEFLVRSPPTYHSHTNSTADVSRILTLTNANELSSFFEGCLNMVE